MIFWSYTRIDNNSRRYCWSQDWEQKRRLYIETKVSPVPDIKVLQTLY